MSVMKMRMLILAVALCAAPSIFAIDVRTVLGPNVAKAVETAVRAAAPDATLTWQDAIIVKRADGSQSKVTVAGIAQTATARGPVVVVEVEFEEFALAAEQRLEAFSAERPQQPTDVLAAVQFSSAGGVLESRITRLDHTSAAVETKQFALVDPAGGVWPSVEVTYWARYGTTAFHGSVRWYAVYDFDLLGNYSRMPLGITKVVNGGAEVSEPVAAERADDATVEVTGGITEHVLVLPCAYPCLFDGTTLLAGWTSTMPELAEERVAD